MSEPRAASIILSVGTEITEGIILNTHLRFLGAELKKLGLPVARAVQIPDSLPLFLEELRRATGEGGLVIVTGGLGPTSDDLTRQAVAEVAGVPLDFQESIWEALQRRFPGRKLSETNRRQALVPRGFRVLANEHGTAPGFCGPAGAALVACLPGPPRELEPMFRRELEPVLLSRFSLAVPGELAATSLMVPESELEEALRAAAGGTAVSWGTRFCDDRIAFTLREGTEAERETIFARLQERYRPLRIRRGEVTPAGLLFAALKERGITIALAESCTGGLVGKMLTDLAGSSAVFWGGVMAYSNAAKERLLGVDGGLLARHGAVSREAARAMVEGLLAGAAGTPPVARAVHGVAPAGAGLAVTGIAGPSGGTPEKPVGTVWIAAAARGGSTLERRFRFFGDRDGVRRRAAVAALLLAETVVAHTGWLDSWPES